MKKILYILLFFILSGCTDILDKLPADKPSDASFFSNEKELVMGINACYKEVLMPIGMWTDAISDIGLVRLAGRGDIYLLGIGTQTPSETGMILSFWTDCYKGIAKCNSLLANMHRAEKNTNAGVYSRIKAEARYLRAYYYALLVSLYGDIPLIKEPLLLSESMVANTPKSETVEFILQELTECANDLPTKYDAANTGRTTKGAALAIKARTALYNGKWDVAANAAKAVMDLNAYQLYPDYRKLFLNAAQSNEEVVFEAQYLLGNLTHKSAQDLFSRNNSGLSMFFPAQSLVDSYECTDGLTIDQSPMYDKANPFSNRDPRLDMTILRDGLLFGGKVFSTNPKDKTTLNMNTGVMINNLDVTNAYASASGYNWLKYCDEEDLDNVATCDFNTILCRYAEVLLTYSEAKIELNQIDNSVLDVINQVRARAYGKTVDQKSEYPAITTKEQLALRKIIRRERKVELAGEGLRIFDIKRWGIFEKAMNGPVYGRPNGDFDIVGIPVFDENELPDYSVDASKRKFVYDRACTNAKILWPIPQKEIDVNPNLKQNTGY